MTPGFARPRSELPWLPYESLNRVIINAHNFTPAVNYGVPSGAHLVSAWIPSLDTAGNATTTLSDLAGTRPGTLTNGPTWVSDTANGGVRALQFDATNDYVAGIAGLNLASPMSWSIWFKRVTGDFNQLCGQGDGASTGVYLNCNTSGQLSWQGVFSNIGSATGNAWNHVACTRGSTTSKMYLNGTEIGSTSTWGKTNSASNFEIGRVIFSSGFFYNGNGRRIDDVRMFDAELISTDVSYLYNSGNGRGRVA